MALPLNDRLLLSQAADYVARKCEVTQKAARNALLDAFASGEVEPVGTLPIRGNRVPLKNIDWRAARVDWKASSIEANSVRTVYWTNVDVSRNQIDKWIRSSLNEAPRGRVRGGARALPPNSSAVIAPPNTPSETRRNTGRPPKYDRDAFNREVVRIANTPDGLPDRAPLTRQMAQWCVNTWGDQPSDSVLRDWISKIFPSSS